MRLTTILLPTLLLALAACSDSKTTTHATAGAGGVGPGQTTAVTTASSSGSSGMASGTTSNTSDSGIAAAAGLAGKYAPDFPIGIALSLQNLNTDKDTIAGNFDHLTAENAMKAAVIHPAETTWNTTEADALADFARSHGWKMTGHCLVWYQQQPTWLFSDLTASDATSIATLKSRLQTHIQYMVNRYGDVVDNWDVVNEALSDDASTTYRSTGSDWYRIFGSEEYIYWAYKYAYDALEAQKAGSAKGKLYYNDYNETQKIDKMLTMAAWLKGKGVTLDGFGFQSHWRVDDYPSVTDIDAAITKAVAAGYKVKVSELDITMYNDYPPPNYTLTPAPQITFTTTVEAQQATRYAGIFTMLRSHKNDITSVTVWGFSDEESWLNGFPVSGRRDYPLLFNDAHKPKAAFTAIQNF